MRARHVLFALLVGVTACVPVFGDFEFQGSGGSAGASTGHGGAGGHTSTTSDTGSATDTTSTSSTAACGDCLGGDCVAGVCQPVMIASGQSQPTGIAVSAESVFWTNAGTGTVMRAPIAGGAPTPIAQSESQPSYLMLDAARVYWTTTSAIRSAPLQGAGASTVTTLGANAKGLAGDGAYLYWQTNTEIRRVQVTGGLGDPLVTAQPMQYTIAVDATRVYWIDALEVDSALKTDGTAKQVVTSTSVCPGGCSWPLAVSGGFVYFQVLDGQAPAHFGIKKVAASGGVPLDLGVAETTRIQSIVVDGADVYLANGALLRVPSAGGSVTTVVPSGVTKIAVDAKQLYWTDSSGGAVYRLAK